MTEPARIIGRAPETPSTRVVRRPVARQGCHDLDPAWPGANGAPRGPRLCVLYPECSCGKEDARTKKETP